MSAFMLSTQIPGDINKCEQIPLTCHAEKGSVPSVICSAGDIRERMGPRNIESLARL